MRYALLLSTDDRPEAISYHQETEHYQPCYKDFAYLAFTVGMTYRVSDTDLASPRMRIGARAGPGLVPVGRGHPGLPPSTSCSSWRTTDGHRRRVDRRAPPRTWANAVAPVIAGTGAAAWLHGAVWWKALLALAVSLALIVGVNYANDYSDGIRGTDDEQGQAALAAWSARKSPRRARVLTAAIVHHGGGRRRSGAGGVSAP